MPPGTRPPTPPDIVRVSIDGDIAGQPFTNVYHCQTDNDITSSAGVDDFIDAFLSALSGSSLIGGLSNVTHVTGIQGVVQLDEDSAVEAQSSASITGGNGSPYLPASMCAVLSWLSSAYWRGGKPRTYLGGLSSSSADTNHSLLDSFKTSLQSLAEDFLDGVNAITTPAVDQTKMGFVSYATGKVWRTTPVFFEYSGVRIHDRLGSQRRRLGPWLS